MTLPDDGKSSGRKPAVFDPDDPNLKVQEIPSLEYGLDSGPGGEDSLDERKSITIPTVQDLKRGIQWGGLLVASLLGLVTLLAGQWLTALVLDMLSRQDWIGWASLGLLSLAGFAAFMIALREVAGILRLRRVSRIRQNAEGAIRNQDKKLAVRASGAVKSIFRDRKDLVWGMDRLKEHEKDILDAEELLRLTERELLKPLDEKANMIISASARRVSIVTAISPWAVLDMIFVGAENLRMLRKLASLYGGRPGTVGLLRLAKMVFSHLALSGGLAITNDFIQQLIGQKLTAKISARLGEGIVNGALCARIGLAALEICRPMPYIEGQPPKFGALLAQIAKGGSASKSS